ALVPFAFKEAQEFLANFRAGRHHLYCNVAGEEQGLTTEGTEDTEEEEIGLSLYPKTISSNYLDVPAPQARDNGSPARKGWVS
ncbi:MAG: hypothetical protein ACXV78_05975, partial [Candidatus Angelobacter sp.]